MEESPGKSSPISYAAMALLTGNWCPRRTTVLSNMRIIGQNNHMRRQGWGSEGCGDSNRSGRLSGSWVLMLPFKIYSTWEGILWGRSIIVISGSVRLASGARRWLEIRSQISAVGRH